MEKITDEVKITFRHKLSELIRLRGISKQELCRKVGITYNALFYYETGKRFPKTDVLFNLASALGVSVEELLGQPVSLSTENTVSKNISYFKPQRKAYKKMNDEFIDDLDLDLDSKPKKQHKSYIVEYLKAEDSADSVNYPKVIDIVDFAKRKLTKPLAHYFYYNLYDLIMYDKNNTNNITLTLPNGATKILNNEDYLNFILLKLQKSLLEFKDNYDNHPIKIDENL